MRALRRWWSFLLYGGGGRLRDYEIRILDAVRASMSKADSNAVAQQLANLDRVKRLHDDRVVRLYFYRAKNLPRLANQGSEQIIARMVLKSGEKRIYAVAMGDHGLLSSLEFDKAPGALAGGGRPELAVCGRDRRGGGGRCRGRPCRPGR